MPRLVLLCALLACSFAASAAKMSDMAGIQIESSLHVTGTIDIGPSGDVIAHTLDQPQKLPKGIIDMAARIVPQWKFEPVALQGVKISRSNMNLLFIGKKLDNGDFLIDLHSATFSGGNPDELAGLDAKQRRLPKYPDQLLGAGISGTVFVMVKIGRDGKVIAAEASHVNLRVIGSESEMDLWRSTLARNSIAAIKRWTFIAPKTGPEAEKAYWMGTLPVDYLIGGQKIPAYGTWQTYVAGPKALIPWQDDTFKPGVNPDALTPNTFHPAGVGRQLLTPLPGG